MEQYDVIVIGGGPAGMAAAVSAYDAGAKKTLILDREESLGGILRQCIHPGFGLHSLGRELTGPEYADVYARQVRERKIPVYLGTTVTRIRQDRVVIARSERGILELRANAIVLAMGCRERSRGALSIPGTRPAGVYSAGTAQKLINCHGCMVGKRVVILGSGDIGLIMARRLTLEGAKVEAVCELQPYPGGLTRNIVQCLQDFEIPLYLSTTVSEIHGKQRVEAVTVVQVDDRKQPIAGSQRRIPCDTLLLSVGLLPENELTAEAGIPIDPATRGAYVDETCQTRVPGIYACGNVLQVHDLVDYVSAEAERAGKGAAGFGTRDLGAAVPVEPGAGVRYVVPQQVHPENPQEISLFFRVGKPCGAVRYTVKAGERVLTAVKRLRASPGEMEKLTLKPGALQGIREKITVSMEELP